MTIKFFISSDHGLIKKIYLRNGLKFKLRYKTEILTIKETILDNCYLGQLPALRQNSTIVDVGAAFGDFCIWAAHQYPQSRVVAFEPQPTSSQLAFENIQDNKVTNVELRCAGVFSSTMAESVHITKTVSPGSFSFLDAHAIADGNLREYEKINFVALSEIIQELQAVDLLKIDCEGGEYDIILNSPTAVFKNIKFLALEWHDNVIKGKNHLEIVTRLNELGFDVRIKPNPVHSYLGLIFARNRSLTN